MLTSHHLSGSLLVTAIVLAACGGTGQEAAAPESAESKTEASPEEASAAAPEAGETATVDDSSEETSAPRSSSKPPPPPPPGSPLGDFMLVHYRDTALIRDAVIDGRPEDTGRAAESLLQLLAIEEMPEAWVDPMERMKASAKRVKDSSDIPGVAAATADIGTSCGWCHEKLGGPVLELGQAPEADGSLRSRMQRHVWATERLWEGLYVPSDEAWQSGAEVLERSPFPKEILEKGGVYAKSAAADFSKLAKVAPKKRTPAERAALYADLLGTCATCHLSME